MQTYLQRQSPDLGEQIARSQKIIDLCSDAIHVLGGDIPEGFSFTFSMNKQPIICLEIQESEYELCLSYFMYWETFHRARLADLQAKQASLLAGAK